MRVPCNKYADTRTHIRIDIPPLTHKLWCAHTYTHSRSDSNSVLPQMKTKYSMKSFPPAGWTWGDCVLHHSSMMPLFSSCFPFSPPPLHTGWETIELHSVCQVVNILKITGRFGSTGRPSLFRLQCARSKRALSALNHNIQTRDES